jgi:ATP-binding cassette subfamily B (MDR/TAP) protein 1
VSAELTVLSRLSRTAIAEGGTLAEEVISTVRTAQAFGTQQKLSSLYDEHADKALVVDAKAAVWNGAF